MAKTIKEKIVEAITPKKEEKVEKKHPEYDEDLPENKQRWTR